MVYFFVCQSDPNVIIYMGKDKYENEDLIKYAWPDVGELVLAAAQEPGRKKRLGPTD